MAPLMLESAHGSGRVLGECPWVYIGVFMTWDGCTGTSHVLPYPVLSYHPSSLQKMNRRQIVTEDFSREKGFNEYLKGHNPTDCVWCHVTVSRFYLLQKLD